MSAGVPGWPYAASPRPWLLPVGVRPRLAAWLLDMVFVAIWSLLPLAVAVAAGGVAWNPAAMRQTDSNPLAVPDVPWLIVGTEPLVAAAALWVVLAIVYGAVCWSAFRGLPGQRIRGLQVADVRSGKNLSPLRATVRSILVNGIPAAGMAVALVGMAELMAIVPANDTSDPTLLNSGPGQHWASAVLVGGLVAVAWPAILGITIAGNLGWRGLHDRMAGSIVVGLMRPRIDWSMAAAGWTPYGPGGSMTGMGPVGAPPPAGPAGAPGLDQGAPEGETGSPPAEPGQILPGWTGLSPDRGRPAPGVWPGVLAPGAGVRAGTAEDEEPGPRYRAAAFRRRMSAYSIDVIVVYAMYSAIEYFVAPPDAAGNVAPERLWMLAGLLSAAAQAVYFVIPWWLTGGSPGHKALNLRVARDVTGSRIGPIDALVRWAVLQGPLALWMAAPFAISLLLFIATVGWGIVLMRSVRMDADGRGYHDRLAGSMVLEEA